MLSRLTRVDYRFLKTAVNICERQRSILQEEFFFWCCSGAIKLPKTVQGNPHLWYTTWKKKVREREGTDD